MQQKTFGNHDVKSADDYTKELQELVGAEFPITMTMQNGQIVGFSYQTEWQEGTTKAVVVGSKAKKTQHTEYKGDYTKKSLTKEQIKKVDAWAKNNVTGA